MRYGQEAKTEERSVSMGSVAFQRWLPRTGSWPLAFLPFMVTAGGRCGLELTRELYVSTVAGGMSLRRPMVLPGDMSGRSRVERTARSGSAPLRVAWRASMEERCSQFHR